MTNMRAVGQDSFGGPEVLKIVEVERPEPGPVEILVRVHAASVNPTDWKARANGGRFGAARPTLGFDVSGVVSAVGPGVTLYEPGDEVFGMPRFPHPAGAYAEYVTAPPRHFIRKPASLDHVQAAALPLVALTAWQGLVDTAGLRPGQRVLVHAAVGGVGHVAVQIAKAQGAYVIGTARTPKHAFVRSLGADEVIDYTEVDFAEAVRGVDVVLDTIGGDYGPRSLRTLRDGGVLVSIVPPVEEPLRSAAAERGVKTGWTLVEPDYAGLKEIVALVESGRLHAEIDTVFPLEEAAKAHALGETGRTTGKIVLTVA
jgi:NADPH:quinone reductase-like Zn-dependent oxidoreductase